MSVLVERGEITFAPGETLKTLTAGIDYQMPETNAKGFLRISAAHYASIGQDDITPGNPQEVEVAIWNPENIRLSLDLRRIDSIHETRLRWEMLQSTAIEENTNRWTVRLYERITMNPGTGTALSSLVTANDPARLACFVCSRRTDTDDYTRSPAGLVTTEYDAGRIKVTRLYTANTAQITIAVVEFTGENWKNVQYLNPTITQSPQTIALTTPLDNLEHAFLLVSNTANRPASGFSMSELLVSAELINTTQIECRVGTVASQSVSIWVIENSGGELIAQSARQTLPAGIKSGTQQISNILDTTRASIEGPTSEVRQESLVFAEGYGNVYLQDETTVAFDCALAGSERFFSARVVKWPPNIQVGGPGAASRQLPIGYGSEPGALDLASIFEFIKVPEEELDYSWTGEKEFEQNEIIGLAIWDLPASLQNKGQNITGKVATVKIAGGTAEEIYPVRVTITTQGGQWIRRFDRVFNLRIVSAAGAKS